MPYFYIDPYYIILVIPAILLSLLAQVRVKTTFHKYSQVGNYRGLTGAQAASRILQDNGITNVAVERVGGNLTDHFDPKAMVIRLSDSVYNSSSIAAVGVAAHEAGHAVQDAVGYAPIRIRNAIVPVVNFGSALSWPLVLFGILFSYSFLINIGIILFLRHIGVSDHHVACGIQCKQPGHGYFGKLGNAFRPGAQRRPQRFDSGGHDLCGGSYRQYCPSAQAFAAYEGASR